VRERQRGERRETGKRGKGREGWPKEERGLANGNRGQDMCVHECMGVVGFHDRMHAYMSVRY